MSKRVTITEHLTADELKVLTLREWAALCGFSFMTGKRLMARGENAFAPMAQ